MSTQPKLTFLLALACLAPAAGAGILKVPKQFGTIQAAVDAAQPGDQIVVSGGTYDEAVLLSAKSDLTLRAAGKVILDTAVPGEGLFGTLTLVACENVIVKGIRVRGGAPGIGVMGSNGITLTRCRVEDSVGNAIRVAGSTGVTVERCRLLRSGASAIVMDDVKQASVERNNIQVTGSGGIAFSVGVIETSDDSLIARNKLRLIGDDAISVRGHDNLVERNNISRSGGCGLVLDRDGDSSGNTLSRNRVHLPNCHGLYLGGVGNRAERNVVLLAALDGINVAGLDHVLELNRLIKPEGDGIDVDLLGTEGVLEGSLTFLRNRIVAPGDTGMDIDTPGSTLDRNRVVKAGIDGIAIQSSGNTVRDNVALKSNIDGIWVTAGQNTFTGNRAAGSGLFDLEDGSQSGTNVYTDNKFKNQVIL